jgi:hypothetical protein
MCQLQSFSVGSTNCTCNGKYVISQCEVTHNADNSCKVISQYEYAGRCDNRTFAPTPAPSPPKTCPNKECHGQNKESVRKVKGKCDSIILNKFCVKSKLIAKMNADLQCNVENNCLCTGKYTLARCYSIPFRSQPSTQSLFNPYCYYVAKYTYDGKCLKTYTYPGVLGNNTIAGSLSDGRVQLP